MNRHVEPMAKAGTAHPAGPRSVAILGATGSIGCSTIALLRNNPDFTIEVLTAQSNVEKLIEQARDLRPRAVAIGEDRHYATLKAALADDGIAVSAGRAALIEAAERPADWVMSAIVGMAGLAPTLAAVKRGAVVAIANKESLVSAGPVVLAEVARSGATLLPVDSEHNAIFQVFDFDRPERVEKIILTASGGPFRTASRAVLEAATPAQALKHPNWSMGAKISIDSATLMNKGLELIEAARLFPVPEPRIEVLIHPQSVVHSMVAYVDGSFLAQLGTPDMRTPIAYSLAWPDRLVVDAPRLDLATLGTLTFEAPDHDRFPALTLARAALRQGGLAPCVLNAANEIAVQGFLEGRVRFVDIVSVVARTVEALDNRRGAGGEPTLADVEAADAEARRVAGEIIRGVGA